MAEESRRTRLRFTPSWQYPSPPPLPPQCLEVSCRISGKSWRFAAGTDAGFAVALINQKQKGAVPVATHIEAEKDGEEPIAFGPNAVLFHFGEGWKLHTVTLLPSGIEPEQSKSHHGIEPEQSKSHHGKSYLTENSDVKKDIPELTSIEPEQSKSHHGKSYLTENSDVQEDIPELTSIAPEQSKSCHGKSYLTENSDVQKDIPELTSIEPEQSKSHHHGKIYLTENSDVQKDIPELTSELLELIAKHLDLASFCAFGAVCKSWLEIYNRYREDFLESQAPMAVLASSHARETCYLYDMANGKTKEVMLHNLDGKSIVGCSAGYVIMEDESRRITLVNPLTGHRLNFRIPPFIFRYKHSYLSLLHDHIILASTLSSRSYIVVAISIKQQEYQVWHSKIGQCLGRLLSGQQWVDMVVFKHQVYVITYKARLVKLMIKETDSIKWLYVRNTPNVDSLDLKLVVSGNQLLMVDFVPLKHLNIYKMDFDAMKWVKLDSLGDQALFLGGKWGSAMRKPARWGGQSNCVYHLETRSAMCHIYTMDAKLIDSFSLVENSTISGLCSLGWYNPHQCMQVDYLDVDYGI